MREHFEHVVDHLVGDAGIHADPERVVHDQIGVRQRADDQAVDVDVGGLTEQIAGEDQTGGDMARF